MSFTMFVKKTSSTTSTAVNPAAVYVAVNQRKFKENTGHILTITIGAEVLAEAHMKPGEKVNLFFGEDEDKGKVKIAKVGPHAKASEGILISVLGKRHEGDHPNGTVAAMISAKPPIADFSAAPIAKTAVDHVVAPLEGLIITLPEGFFIPADHHKKGGKK